MRPIVLVAQAERRVATVAETAVEIDASHTLLGHVEKKIGSPERRCEHIAHPIRAAI